MIGFPFFAKKIIMKFFFSVKRTMVCYVLLTKNPPEVEKTRCDSVMVRV